MRIMIQRTLILFVFRKHMAYKREKKSGMALNRYFKAYFFVTIVVQVLSYRCNRHTREGGYPLDTRWSLWIPDKSIRV